MKGMGCGQYLFGFICAAFVALFAFGNVALSKISEPLGFVWMAFLIGLAIFFVAYRRRKIIEFNEDLQQKLEDLAFITSEKVTLKDPGSFMLGIRPEAGIWFDYPNKRVFIRKFERYNPNLPLSTYGSSDILDYRLSWDDTRKTTTRTTTFIGIPIASSSSATNFVTDIELLIKVRTSTGFQVITLRPFYNNVIKSGGLNSHWVRKQKEALQRMFDSLEYLLAVRCPKCGRILERGVAFCNNCGAKIEAN